MSFAPCPACSRHVKTTDTTCPFCERPLAPADVVAVPGAIQRMSRAAAYAFSASLVVAGCSGGVEPIGDGGTDDGGNDGSSGSTSDGGRDAGREGAPEDDGGVMPPYGLPPVDGGG